MVRALDEEQENYKSKLFHFKGMHEDAARHAKSLSVESAAALDVSEDDDITTFRSQGARPSNDSTPERQQIGSIFNRNDKGPRSRLSKDEAGVGPFRCQCSDKQPSDMELMKERFAKLLLGEDMSGGGKGVSSALALSNAITNIAASVFGERNKLEPMPAETKKRWRREIDWLLSVTDYIVEFVPSQQISKDGKSMEVMTTQPRTDLHMNIPALRKLDAMLLDCLDNFREQHEFYYVKGDAANSDEGNTKRNEDKWWLPTVKVPPDGLSDMAKKFLQYQKDCVNQVLKAAMAINAQVLAEMEIPESYIESLPKNGRSSLGESVYKNITVEFFDPNQFLATMDLSSEHKILDLKNRIEASIIIWKRKMVQKDGKSAWSSAISLEKRELFEERAETILLILKHRFPGLPQSSLDISKIQYNRDIGQAVLESYSRILESLAFTVMSRIEDVLYADLLTQNPSQVACKRNFLANSLQNTGQEKPLSFTDDAENQSSSEISASRTLLDFMGWDHGDGEQKKDSSIDGLVKEGDGEYMDKLSYLTMNKKASYLEHLGGLCSPTARH